VAEYLVAERSEFDRIIQDADRVFDTRAEFPGPVCRIEAAEAFWFEDATVAAGPFWPNLKRLALLHGDAHIEVAVIKPDPAAYFFSTFGIFSAMRLSVELTAEDYWAALTEGPPGSDADALAYNAERWIATGESAAWGLWSERGVELATVYSRATPGLAAWRHGLTEQPLTLEEAEEILSLTYGRAVPSHVKSALHDNWDA
jgi:hypothetical protein